MSRIHRKNAFIRLKNRINCIPAGVYEVLGEKDETIILAVSSRIQFSVSGADREMLEWLPYSSGKLRKTSEAKFVKSYFHLLYRFGENIEHQPLLPFTSCWMDRSVYEDYPHWSMAGRELAA
ncbi:MAG: hypothetical protein D6719_11510 [Candidatus Dadabacteria bacterium]|nr:MAG: hypothetical protein D6719_11510 [Candidatus Dadabacteria bacterium]